MKEWNLKQLADAMARDIAQCGTPHERVMVRAIGGKEIRERAEQIAAVRKLTPGEIAIASQYGFR